MLPVRPADVRGESDEREAGYASGEDAGRVQAEDTMSDDSPSSILSHRQTGWLTSFCFECFQFSMHPARRTDVWVQESTDEVEEVDGGLQNLMSFNVFVVVALRPVVVN